MRTSEYDRSQVQAIDGEPTLRHSEHHQKQLNELNEVLTSVRGVLRSLRDRHLGCTPDEVGKEGPTPVPNGVQAQLRDDMQHAIRRAYDIQELAHLLNNEL